MGFHPSAHSPLHIFPPSDQMAKDLVDGVNTLRRRVAIASLMLNPQIKALLTGAEPPRLDGFPPTVENISLAMTRTLHWSSESVSTVKSKIFAPTKPIAHLAYAFMEEFLFPRIQSNPGKMTILDRLFPLPDLATLRRILTRAEQFRNALQHIRQFRISEDATIQFTQTD
jgi:hypothetical protein